MFIHILLISSIIGSNLGPLPQSWQSPLTTLEIANIYKAPATRYSAGHRGIDLQATIDETVYAPVSGTVSFVGKVGFRSLITISFEDRKLELEPVCSSLSLGSFVNMGEVIGSVCQGDTLYRWHCPSCLHMSLRNPNGYLTPEMFLREMPPSRLKP